tara:strand:+ start:275 stop:682 length:408 start_codon:yes stop_codon:yes gene_type:complete
MRLDAARNPEKTVDKVAEQFESIFINMMLKSMRNATERSSLMDSQAGRMYESMFDQEVSLHLAKKGSLGLAETIKSQIQRNQERLVHENDKAYSLDPELSGRKIISEEHSYSIDLKKRNFSLDRGLAPSETGAGK